MNYQYLGIENQWLFGLALAYKDKDVPVSSVHELRVSDLSSFLIIEETGNMLPTWELSFTSGPKWRPYWNENSILYVIMGRSRYRAIINTRLLIISKSVKDLGNGLHLYSATGVYDAPAFTQTPHIRTFGPCPGMNVVKRLAEEHFEKYEGDVVGQEVMPWYQSHFSDKKMMDECVSHTYIPDSFPCVGITMNGVYKVKDVVKLAKEQPKYKIGGEGADSVKLISMPRFISRSGLLNHVSGYGVDTPIISGEYGVRTAYRPNIKLGLSSNNPVNNGLVERKTRPPIYFNTSNVDSRYHLGKANYDSGQALLSMELAEFTVFDPFLEIQVLDLITLLDPISNSQVLSQDTSGKYIVNRVARGIQGSTAMTTVQVSRDSHNQQT